MVYQLERAAPTPTQEAIMVTLQWLAFREGVRKSHRLVQRIWSVTQDVPQKQASDNTATGSDTSIVGTRAVVAGRNRNLWIGVRPTLLRVNLIVDLFAAGYVKNPCDKCLFIVFSNKDTSEGQVLIDDDDFFGTGTETHRNAMDNFWGSNCSFRKGASPCS